MRIYNPLFAKPDPGWGGFRPRSQPEFAARCLADARLDASLAAANGRAGQFERQGYFCVDRQLTASHLVFNRTIGLRDTYAKDLVNGDTSGRSAIAEAVDCERILYLSPSGRGRERSDRVGAIGLC